MSADQPESLIDPRPGALVRRSFGGTPRIDPIAGDASTRRFFRVTAGKRTALLMVEPDPLDETSPLYSNHRTLDRIGAPIARILDRDDGAGAVLLEDLGDTTLQSHLTGGSGVSGEARRALYREACDLIVLLQTKGTAALRAGEFARDHALDRERFLFEMGHFHRHFIVGLRGLDPGGADETALRAFYDELAAGCDAMPRVYCHRDFQSRNLMLHGGRLYLIDYQDARMGPYTYDAASLLRDSSLDLEEALVEDMVAYLAGRLREAPEEFRRDFDLMALQRNIKDLGTFGYMATVRNRHSYLGYVPRTIASIRRTLLRDRHFHLFYPLLERYILSYLT